MIQTYTGPYVVDPTESGRMLSTARRTLRQNVIVSPIPPKHVGSGVKRQASTTITPTEREQIAVPKDTYTTGDVKVKAIPPDYVGPDVQKKSASDLSASGATVTAPAGYYAEDASKTVESGSATTPDTSITANPTISVNASGLITASVSASEQVTPEVSAGYVSGGTAGTVTVTGSETHQLTTQDAATYHPSTTDQTIESGKYLKGAQTIKAVTTANLTAANIKNGVVVEIGDSTDSDCVASVTGTYAGGGSSWTLIGSKEITVNTTSTSAASAGTISCGTDAVTKSKLIYVRIRDKAGPRTGYFYGSDAFFANFYVANNPNTGSTLNAAARIGQMYTSSGQWASGGSSYGVYGYSISPAGDVTIRRRYSSSYGTINGTFLVQVYALDYPDNKSPFDTGVIS